MLLINSSIAQVLNLSELILLRNSDYEYIDDFLIKKGWEFKSSKGTNSKPSIVWGYTATPFSNEASLSWLNFGYKNTVVDYNFSKKYYETVKSSIKSYGLKLENNKHEKNSVKSIYKNNSLTAILYIKSGILQISQYRLIVCKNEDYTTVEKDLRKEEEEEIKLWK